METLTTALTAAPVFPFPARQPALGACEAYATRAGQEGASLDALFRNAALESFDAGQTVFWEGDGAGDVFTVVEGLLRLYRSLPDGRRAITGFACAGEIVGIAFSRRYPCSAEAVAEIKLRRVSRRSFYTAADEIPRLHSDALATIAKELARAQDQIVLLGRKTADERVASFILAMAERIGHSPREIDLPMSRLDMADYLGLTIETVSRVLTRMQRDGLISFRGRYHLIIERPRCLRELGGGADEARDDDLPLACTG
ncbi:MULTISPECIES: helix-turn-helix domain-containing protein [unclassified Chelatococcus]|uniref:helix-turn-helix domain-containing protein n=1 Tax=unclassified Chelatococcus TaxID=2638111 RepID=UPI001BCCD3F1|nr:MULTISPECIES: helix-turn-helix domain-containing protein [unclassified Chelatococcus]MBS7696651.1 helix-turn-helix domain-containing protein [Chelatococcus sp. YT9]MBX3555216.1 helix-turn-helix domain-containing protein [Chelatococcus sp.]